MNATDVRTELGARFDDPTLLYGKPLILFGRARLGARLRQQSSTQRRISNVPGQASPSTARRSRRTPRSLTPARNFSLRNWSLLAKFDGEFA